MKRRDFLFELSDIMAECVAGASLGDVASRKFTKREMTSMRNDLNARFGRLMGVFGALAIGSHIRILRQIEKDLDLE